MIKFVSMVVVLVATNVGVAQSQPSAPKERPLIVNYECSISDIASAPKANAALVVKSVVVDKAGKTYEFYKDDKISFSLEVPVSTRIDSVGRPSENTKTVHLYMHNVKTGKGTYTAAGLGNSLTLGDYGFAKVINCIAQ